jgi:beta-lactamase regulating signal transducer with metallopeptidase domain
MSIVELLLESLPTFLTNVVWQAAVILGVALLLERQVRRHATARHAVLFCGLIASLAVPAIVPLEHRLGLQLVSWTRRTAAQGTEFQLAFVEADLGLNQQASPLQTSIEPEADWRSLLTFAEGLNLAIVSLLVIWSGGSTVCIVRFATGWWALRKLCVAAKPASGEVFDLALQKLRRFRPGPIPRILVSNRLKAPLSAGLVRPYVLLPRFALDAQSAAELCTVLLHEVAHVRRCDVAVVYLQRIATMLFWPNPLLHRLNRLLDEAREDICDNYVITVTDPVEYSRTLLTFGCRDETYNAAYPATCLVRNGRTLEQRIRGLLDEGRKPLTRLGRKTAIVFVSMFTTLVIGLGTLQVPVQAARPSRDALTVLNKGIEALNGEAALKRCEAISWRFTGKAYGPDGVASISGRCYRQGGDQFRCETVFELEAVRAESIEVINGSEGWVKGKAGQVVPIADEEDFAQTKVHRLYLSWITTLLPLKGKAYKISPAGELRIGDHQTTGILVFRRGYSDVVLYFDKETGLLAKSEMPVKVTRGAEHELGRVRVQETYFEEYGQSDGARYPCKIATYLDGKLRRRVEITELQTHHGLGSALFVKP